MDKTASNNSSRNLSRTFLILGLAAFVLSLAVAVGSDRMWGVAKVLYAFQVFYLLGFYFSLRWTIVGRGREERVKSIVYAVLNFLLGAFFIFTAAVFPGCVTIEIPRQRLTNPDIIPIAYSKNYEIRLAGKENLSTFDVHKYSKIRNELIREGLRKRSEFLVPRKISRGELLLVHTEEYLARMRSSKYVAKVLEVPPIKIMPSGLMRETILKSFMYASEGTVLAGRRALEGGIAVNLGGGYAHASSEQGEGFGLIADVPIAIRALQKEGLIGRAMIVDTDVHKGNGDILVFKDDDSVFVFDMYENGIYPTGHFKVAADRDIPLSHGMSEKEYLRLLEKHLPGAINEAKPDIIFYVAGSDPYCKDRLGSIQMSFEGMVKRDMFVVDEARRRNIPIAMVLSGGYSAESWRIHFETIKEIILKYEKRQQKPDS